MDQTGNQPHTSIKELVLLFLKLGFTAFGGPAAHIAMLRQEVVDKRGWLSDEEFMDMIGATNLIPGPNSTEMVLHVGYSRAGVPGLIMAGLSFILPAMSLVLLFSWMYKRFGTTPQADWLLYGVKPVIIAVILQALYGLGKKAIKSPLTAAAGAGVLAGYFLGGHELLLLAAGGLLVMIMANAPRLSSFSAGLLPLWFSKVSHYFMLNVSGVRLSTLFLAFLKIGAVLYGSGYVLLAFLRADLVERLGWLTDQQLIDAIAVGQITPGPVFTTATFVGYLLLGLPGAVAATVGIFLPAFILVGITHPLIHRLRLSPWSAALLDGVNASALGLMAAVTWQLGRAALVDPLTVLLAALSGVILFGFRLNSAWLVLAGAVIGVARGFFWLG